MSRISLFFFGLSFLFLLSGCGQTGSLYYPKPLKHPSKKASATTPPPATSTSVKKNETVI